MLGFEKCFPKFGPAWVFAGGARVVDSGQSTGECAESGQRGERVERKVAEEDVEMVVVVVVW